MTVLVWDEKCPPEIRAAVEPLIERWRHIIPTWCHSLWIAYNADTDNCMECEAHPEYRWAKIHVGGSWLRQPGHERESAVVHELVHIPLKVLTDWTKDLVFRLSGDDERLRDWLLSEWQERLEGVTCDLERTMQSA